jgi:hypothetical protein
MTERTLTPEIAGASVRRQMKALDDAPLRQNDEGGRKGDRYGALSALPFSQAR